MYAHRAVSDVGGKLIVGSTKTGASTAGAGPE